MTTAQTDKTGHQLGRGRRVLGAIVALVCATALMACEKPQWDNPEYISKRLRQGDSAGRSLALDHLDDLDEADQKKVAPALSEVYLDGGTNQKEAMQLLVQLRVPSAKKAYMQEVRQDDTGYAAAAAEALGEAGVTEALDDMISLYKSSDDMELKKGLLRAFSHIPDPKLVGVLTDTLKLDVDNYPIALHAYSCEILGDIGQKTPQALSEATKSAMVRALFVGNMKGQDVARECGLAIQQLGMPAAGLLEQTFAGKNQSVNTVLTKYNKAPNYRFPQNRAKAAAAVRLSTLRAKSAVALFIDDLSATKAAPEQFAGQHAVSWRSTEAQAASEEINGLGDLGDKKATELLVDIVTDEYTNDEWDDITDGFVELQLRQDAGFSLARLGNRQAADALLEMAQDGVIVDLEKRAAMVQDTKRPMPITQRYQFNWMMARAYADLVGADGLDGLVDLIKSTDEEKLKAKYKSFIPMLKQGAQCLNKAKPPAQGKCFGKMLASDDEMVREKAAYELSRLPKNVAAPIINAHLPDDHLATRELLTFAAYRAPTAAMVDTIDTIRKDEENRSDKGYKLDHHRLKLLRAWLQNNVDALAGK